MNYHIYIIISSYIESFKLEPVGEEKVIIIGTQSPRGPRWVLIVREDEAGVPDRYPRFHPEEDVLVSAHI